MLQDIYDVLPEAMWETHYGAASAPYQAFFKTTDYAMIVEEELKAVSIGMPLRLDHGKGILKPRIVCALKPDTVIFHKAGQDVDVYDVCKRDSTSTVMHYPETSDIFICSLFFQVPPLPSIGGCPTVNEATNKLEGSFAGFWLSQTYFLLHEILHFYIGATVELRMDEIMDWNYAVSLPGPNATLNALNYVLFVASTYNLSVLSHLDSDILIQASKKGAKISLEQIWRSRLERCPICWTHP